eukprot:TRINITY_DN40944_c0_g1_i1.p2 TRINITY_DN40944_c0_g1~~TRINITY_DN40944_c0_g1_i1.p2  ORF type:complete len:178 (-),score=40.07 TRINITY_DN40944_c0_g1_i1:134-667(-)
MAMKQPLTGGEQPTFFKKYIAPNIFNFYPAASLVAILYFGSKNGFDYDETMTNGGDWIVFLLCVKIVMIHNGIAHLNPKCMDIVAKSQGLTQNEASRMFENELGAVCLSFAIFAILAGEGEAVATISKGLGGFFLYAAVRHVAEGQPIGTALGGFGTAVFQFAAGFHAAPFKFPTVF